MIFAFIYSKMGIFNNKGNSKMEMEFIIFMICKGIKFISQNTDKVINSKEHMSLTILMDQLRKKPKLIKKKEI